MKFVSGLKQYSVPPNGETKFPRPVIISRNPRRYLGVIFRGIERATRFSAEQRDLVRLKIDLSTSRQDFPPFPELMSELNDSARPTVVSEYENVVKTREMNF